MVGTTRPGQSAVVIKLNGEPIATGIANVAITAGDFYGEKDNRVIRDVRIDELFLTKDHPDFEKWNALVGRTVDPEVVWGEQKK